MFGIVDREEEKPIKRKMLDSAATEYIQIKASNAEV